MTAKTPSGEGTRGVGRDWGVTARTGAVAGAACLRQLVLQSCVPAPPTLTPSPGFLQAGMASA